MNQRAMTPTKLRLILGLLLVLLGGVTFGVFMVGYNQLKTHAIAAQEVASKAQASQSSLNTLIATERLLEVNQDAVARADQLVAQSKSYVYQDQIIADINRYANEAGLFVTNISFADTKTTQVSTPPPTAAQTGTGQTPPASATPTGIKTMTATVALKSPVDYNAMLTFLHLLEESLFKMQISQVSLSRATEGSSGDKILSDILTIEVYVR